MTGYPEDEDEPTPEKFLAARSVPLPVALTIGEHRAALVGLLESRLSALDDERTRTFDALAALRAL